MRKYIILLLSFNVYANPAIMGNNSGDNSKTIFASELNIYNLSLYNNTSIIHYGEDWTYGVQVSNINISGFQTQNYENDMYVTLARKFNYNDIGFEIGGQAGYNIGNTPTKLHATSYADISFNVLDGLSLHFGGYYVNDELATIHQPFNFKAGIKYKINSFIITGDYYSGNNNLSGGIINLFYKASPTLRPYIGIIVPESGSGNDFAGITGVSWKLF